MKRKVSHICDVNAPVRDSFANRRAVEIGRYSNHSGCDVVLLVNNNWSADKITRRKLGLDPGCLNPNVEPRCGMTL